LGHAVNYALGSVGTAWKRYVMLVQLEEKNRQLEQTVASLKREANDLPRDVPWMRETAAAHEHEEGSCVSDRCGQCDTERPIVRILDGIDQ